MRSVDFTTYHLSADSTAVDSSGVGSHSFMSAWQARSTQCSQAQWQGFMGKPHAESLASNDGVVALCGLLFAILAILIHHCFYHLVERVKGFFSNGRQFSLVSPMSAIGELSVTLVLTAVAALCLSLMLAVHVTQLSWAQFSHLSLVELMAFLFVVFFSLFYIKGILYAIINWVFFNPERNRRWFTAYFHLTSIIAFVLFPLSLVDIFAIVNFRIVSFILLFLLILYEFLLFFKLLVNFKTKTYGHVLIFLYFCAVEILPIVILWHFFDKKVAIL